MQKSYLSLNIQSAYKIGITQHRMLNFVAPSFPHGGGTIMPKFKVGDYVERIGSLVPEYMQSGVVTRVIPNDQGLDLFNEYEVNFGNQVVAILYESQLQATKPNP